MRLLALLALSCLVAATHATPAPRTTLKPFASQGEFDALLARWRAQAAPSAAPMAAAKASADSAAAESITNVQTAGVDEGGIVKRAGDPLVILRRGRLFIVRVGDDALAPIAALDAYAPGSDPQGAWYDELLIHDRTVVVIGYSYARGGTEIGLFELGDDGALAYTATHHLKSNDYYSSRNYASRLMGSKLVFHTPTPLNPWACSPNSSCRSGGAGTRPRPITGSASCRPRASTAATTRSIRPTPRKARRAGTASSTRLTRATPASSGCRCSRLRRGAACAANRRGAVPAQPRARSCSPWASCARSRRPTRTISARPAASIGTAMRARSSSVGDRVFALLGYELVEGRIGWRGWPGGRIEELRRVSFAPQLALACGRD